MRGTPGEERGGATGVGREAHAGDAHTQVRVVLRTDGRPSSGSDIVLGRTAHPAADSNHREIPEARWQTATHYDEGSRVYFVRDWIWDIHRSTIDNRQSTMTQTDHQRCAVERNTKPNSKSSARPSTAGRTSQPLPTRHTPPHVGATPRLPATTAQKIVRMEHERLSTRCREIPTNRDGNARTRIPRSTRRLDGSARWRPEEIFPQVVGLSRPHTHLNPARPARQSDPVIKDQSISLRTRSHFCAPGLTRFPKTESLVYKHAASA